MKITVLTVGVTDEVDASVYADTTAAAKALRERFDPENRANPEDIEAWVEQQTDQTVYIEEFDVPLPLLDDLLRGWRIKADICDEEEGQDPRRDATTAAVLRDCATDLETVLGVIDTSSSASIQHYIETGRYLRHGEEA